ncbi:MAG: hypothetical protein KatS3mg068_1463 [Candidatus Sericytochromatia bacterium]|nr:MAG: hypothetical protein KatS3mg068_1463 [Candidatus Sericytochromatia bacterium]
MEYVKKYVNLLLLIIFPLLLLLSITFIIKENFYSNNNNTEIFFNKIKNNFEKFMYSSKINFLYTNIYDKYDIKGKNFTNFYKNRNNIINIFYSKEEYIKQYYENNKDLPILIEDNIYFIPLSYINTENLNNLDLDKIFRTNKIFNNLNNNSILVNYIFIKHYEKIFFIILSLPYDYDINYRNNKRKYIIVFEDKSKKYFKYYELNNFLK